MAATEHNYSHEIENWRQRLVKESKAAKVGTSIVKYMQTCVLRYVFLTGQGSMA
jgi:hypothetical protein